jgi:hypothetical protein
MPRTRWIVAGLLLLAAVLSGLLNARGPFDTHASLGYDQFLTDFQAGQVQRIVQWRDQLEATEGATLFSVVVPAARDLPADLARARQAGGVAIDHSRLPDAWLWTMTTWVPLLLTVAAVLIVVTAVVRSRRAAVGAGAASGVQPAR